MFDEALGRLQALGTSAAAILPGLLLGLLVFGLGLVVGAWRARRGDARRLAARSIGRLGRGAGPHRRWPRHAGGVPDRGLDRLSLGVGRRPVQPARHRRRGDRLCLPRRAAEPARRHPDPAHPPVPHRRPDPPGRSGRHGGGHLGSGDGAAHLRQPPHPDPQRLAVHRQDRGHHRLREAPAAVPADDRQRRRHRPGAQGHRAGAPRHPRRPGRPAARGAGDRPGQRGRGHGGALLDQPAAPARGGGRARWRHRGGQAGPDRGRHRPSLSDLAGACSTTRPRKPTATAPASARDGLPQDAACPDRVGRYCEAIPLLPTPRRQGRMVRTGAPTG